MLLIRFEEVTKSFNGWNAIDALNLSIAEGEFCVLLGSSGSGKTTILKMINQLIRHDRGEIFFSGQNIKTFAPEMLRRRMGYAIQSIGLFPHWTVEDNIAAVPRLLKWPEQRVKKRVAELLDLLGLDADRLAQQYPHRLSGGQQQRVGVARALAADPDILLMDEPFGALDPVTRASLQREILRIHRASGRTIVLVTHDVEEALILATRIVLLDKGVIVRQGVPLDILSHPGNGFVHSFFGGEELGLRLLSLQNVKDRLRPPDDSTGKAIAVDRDLRSALSLMVAWDQHSAPVTDTQGHKVGSIHLADLVRAAQ